LPLIGKACEDSDYVYPCVCQYALTQTIVQKLPLVSGVLSPFVFPLSTIARAPDLTAVGSISGKAPKILSTPSWTDTYLPKLTPVVSCEHYHNLLSSFWPSLFTRLQQHGRHMPCVLIGMGCKLAAYIIQAAFEQGLSTSWWM